MSDTKSDGSNGPNTEMNQSAETDSDETIDILLIPDENEKKMEKFDKSWIIREKRKPSFKIMNEDEPIDLSCPKRPIPILSYPKPWTSDHTIYRTPTSLYLPRPFLPSLPLTPMVFLFRSEMGGHACPKSCPSPTRVRGFEIFHVRVRV